MISTYDSCGTYYINLQNMPLHLATMAKSFVRGTFTGLTHTPYMFVSSIANVVPRFKGYFMEAFLSPGFRGIISSVTLTKVGVILRLFPPLNTHCTPCTHDMLWVKKHRILHSLKESTISSCYQTHILSKAGELPLRILHPTQPHQPRVLHARYVLDQDTRSLCSASLRVWRYFVYSYLPPPEKYRSHCTHDMLWITKRKIFYSLNEGH